MRDKKFAIVNLSSFSIKAHPYRYYVDFTNTFTRFHLSAPGLHVRYMREGMLLSLLSGDHLLRDALCGGVGHRQKRPQAMCRSIDRQ